MNGNAFCTAERSRSEERRVGKSVPLCVDLGGRDRQIAQELADAKIRVFTILIGNDGFGGDGIQTIASGTGGKVFTAADPAALSSVFHEIDTMQKAKFKQVTSDWVDYYRPLSLAGLALAGLAGLGLLGMRYTPW